MTKIKNPESFPSTHKPIHPLTKVLLITNIPTPYRIPLFNEINKQLKDLGIGFKVLFGARGYARRQWVIDEKEFEFEYLFLSGKNLFEGHEERSSFTYSGLYKILKQEKPDVIITNAFSIATTKLWLRSFFKKTPYIIWSGAIRDDSRKSVIRWHRKLLVKRAFGFIAYGTLAKKYLVGLGAKPHSITIGINTVDTRFFSEAVLHQRHKGLHRSDHFELLCIGHLVKRKQIDSLIKIVAQLNNIRNDFKLTLIGSGPEENKLREMTKTLGIDHLVHFEGYKQKHELIPYLAKADCFLFPTQFDIWGLVLIEAMAVGLPCLASIKAGSTIDLIHENYTGFAVDFEDTMKVIEKINYILYQPDNGRKIGENAAKFIAKHYNLSIATMGFVNAIDKIISFPIKHKMQKESNLV